MSFANRVASHVGSNGLIAAEPPAGGAVRNDLSTALGKLYREIFGHGPVSVPTTRRRPSAFPRGAQSRSPLAR